MSGTGQSRNGRFSLEQTEDRLSIYCSFLPAIGQGKPLEYIDLMTRLSEMEISDPFIDKEKIKKIISYVNNSGKKVEKSLIVSGIPPVTKIKEHIEIVFDPQDYITLINKILTEDKSPQIDYKMFSKLCLLNAETVVAKICKAQEGKQGVSVSGQKIDFETPVFKNIRLGENLLKKENGDIVTACFGEYQFNRNTISTKNVLNLQNGVNHETGNIQFEGTVVIHGEVQFDFKIHADGNLIIHNTLGAANVYSGNNIVITNGGIIGKENDTQLVKAENVIKTVHIENAHVDAGNNVFVEKSALNSTIRTNGLLHMGKGSTLLNCKVSAREGITAVDVGNASGVTNSLRCGENFLVEDRVQKIKDRRNKLLASIEEELKRDSMAQTWHITSEVKECDKELEELQSDAECNKDARIDISGTVFPGTDIMICDSKYTVTMALHHGFFYYNKTENKVMFQNH